MSFIDFGEWTTCRLMDTNTVGSRDVIEIGTPVSVFPMAGKRTRCRKKIRSFPATVICLRMSIADAQVASGRQVYLTNIQAKNLLPEDVRQWSGDLWLFPHYTDRSMVPYDARPGGAAHAAYAGIVMQLPAAGQPAVAFGNRIRNVGLTLAALVVLATGVVVVRESQPCLARLRIDEESR